MKQLFLIFYSLFLMIFSLLAQDSEDVLKIWENPHPYLDAIQDGIENSDRSWTSDKQLSDRIRGLAYAINQEIMHAKSKDWETPSPTRLEVIKKWGVILEPYTDELVTLAIGEARNRERSSTQARSILDFAAPTEQFGKIIRQYMTHSYSNVADAAAYLLYEHRLLTTADIDTLRNLIQSPEKPKRMPLTLIRLSFYGVTDGISNARDILRSEPKSGVYESMIRQYGGALDLMQNLGPAAESLLPDLDALISKIDSSQLGESKHGILTKFQYARDLVTGKELMQERFAKNGSGPLSLKIAELPPVRRQGDQTRETNPKSERPEKLRPSAALTNSNTKTKESNFYSNGAIVIFIGLLVIGLLGWLKFQKA